MQQHYLMVQTGNVISNVQK